MAGPLEGVKVVEMAGVGPAPFCGMLLADLGADLVCIERPGTKRDAHDITSRGKRRVAIDLQESGGSEAAMSLIAGADMLVEGFRPGVMERLGLGPAPCQRANPRLVYGRVTGWGQTGPLSGAAGSDINYIALSGALHAVGGGAMLLAVGLLAALHEAKATGRGQVVDAAMTDGAALLPAMFYGMKASGGWSSRRGENLLDGGAHFYDTYACADGKFVSVGALEPRFFARLCELCGLDADFCSGQMDRTRWPLMKLRLADLFLTRTRAEWCELLGGSDGCFAPVLDWDEAPAHPHNEARGTFVTLQGVVQPAPAPRFSRTPARAPTSSRTQPLARVLVEWGVPVTAANEA